MSRKLIALDIDGTILPFFDQLVNQKVLDRIEKLKSLGHEVILSTGRDDLQAYHPASTMKFKGYACCSNGAIFGTFDGNGNYTRIKFESFNPTKNIETAKKRFPDIVFLNQLEQPGKYLTNDIETVQREIKSMSVRELAKEVPIEELKNHNTIKMMFFKKNGGFTPQECDELGIKEITYSSIKIMHFLEVGKPGINKATGLKYVADYLGFDQKDTIAFGDGSNDICMLKWANVGVCIENNNPTVMEAADLVGKSCQENGIIPFLDEIIETGELKIK